MLVTTEQIANGLIKYIDKEIVPKLYAGNSKILATALLNIIKISPESVSRFIDDNALVQLILHKDDDGKYNIDYAKDALIGSMREHGNYVIDFSSSLGKLGSIVIGNNLPKLVFDGNDIQTLHDYIEEKRI